MRPGARSAAGQVIIVQHAVQGKYDAAQTTDENSRYWRNADGLSADVANSPGVRYTLRNRARYETGNNGYAWGMVDTLANHTIGTGPRLKMRLKGQAELNRRIQRRWARWAMQVGLAEKLLTARRGQACDGEGFLVLISNPRLPHRVKLDLSGVEPEMVTTPGALLPVSRYALDGIVLDEAGNPKEYHVLKEHPGGAALIGDAFEYDRVPAEKVVHLFTVLRAGQHRGVPEIMPSLPLYAQMRQFRQATIGAAQIAARLSGALYTKEAAGEGSEGPKSGDLWEIEPGEFPVLPDGYELAQIKAEQPATGFGDFCTNVLSEASRPVSMPKNIALCDSSNYNYSSGRLDHGTYFNGRRIEQARLGGRVCMEKIFEAWIREAVLVYDDMADLKGLLDDDEGIDHIWQWDQPEDVDELKGSNAAKVRLESGQTSFESEYARRGLDADQEMERMAEDLGLTLDEYRAMLVAKLFGNQGAGDRPQTTGDDGDDGDGGDGGGDDNQEDGDGSEA